jgi:hypothetical protein
LRSRTGLNNFDLPTAGVLGLALNRISIEGTGLACLDWHCIDLGESDVTDPMGPATNRDSISDINQNYSNVYLDSAGNIAGSFWSSSPVTYSTSVRICYYNAE